MFEKLSMGLSPTEVNEIVGVEGEAIERVESENQIRATYAYRLPNGSTILCVFVNNSLIDWGLAYDDNRTSDHFRQGIKDQEATANQLALQELEERVTRLREGLSFDDVAYLLRSEGRAQGKVGTEGDLTESYIFPLPFEQDLKAVFYNGKLFSWSWAKIYDRTVYAPVPTPNTHTSVPKAQDAPRNDNAKPPINQIRIPDISEFPVDF